MSIVFEKAEQYDFLSEGQKRVAEEHLIGKNYNSIGDALNVVHLHPGHMHGAFHVRHYGFYVENVEITPDSLPFVLQQVPIKCGGHGDSEHADELGAVQGLVAKVAA